MLAVMLLSAVLGQDTLSFSDPRWELRGDSTRRVMVAGRQAVAMYTGSATRRDIRLQDGTIDVDIRTTRRRSFLYLKFRMQGDDEHEEFYLRPHKSDLPDAVQYAPVYRGQSAWQLYHGERGTASPVMEPGEWQRVRIVLNGSRMAVFVRDTVVPVLDVELARTPQPGYIALSAFVPPGTPGSGPIAWFSGLHIRPNHVPHEFKPLARPALTAGTITRWTLGAPFVAKTITPRAIDPAWRLSATVAEVEPNGVVALNRWLPMPAGYSSAARNDVGTLATATLVADSAGLYPLQLGFSDAVTVFVNGIPIMHNDDSYLFAQRRDGLITFEQATVYLPLRKGRNELAVMVTDHFGGWGLMARLVESRGVTITP